MVIAHKTVRVFFKKEGRCVYISHLDLARTMDRAIARSGIDVWYTLGFNPHIYLTFALPLSLGTKSLCESMEFRIAPEEEMATVLPRLNAVLPEGLQAYDIGEPVMEPKAIMWADYRLELGCDAEEMRQAFERLCAKPEIVMQKRSKKGMKEVDIRPMFSLLQAEPISGGLEILLRCRAGVEINLNPTLLLEALEQYEHCSLHGVSITRITVLTEELETFR